MRWSEVQAIHSSQRGILVKNGLVVSLLCNQAKDAVYADEVHETEIRYRVTSSTPASDVRALKAMARTHAALNVFEKRGVNDWISHGLWEVIESFPEGEGTTFILHPKRDSE